MGKTISDADRARARRQRAIFDMTTNESGNTISDADRRMMEMLLDESGNTISDADRARLMSQYINRNDGGIAKKTRTF